ncbi:uncharacterized protein LOC123561819 [Mercenaria mercenaria]|uniref:uncharacterized protein LOC123561819 n=1 Tax=Mercenaria mercenaria TaxID=6596 RepID=UPI00234E749A|nr:uncharacterized protein LOC123561819 [Mercenaria mercenaria]
MMGSSSGKAKPKIEDNKTNNSGAKEGTTSSDPATYNKQVPPVEEKVASDRKSQSDISKQKEQKENTSSGTESDKKITVTATNTGEESKAKLGNSKQKEQKENTSGGTESEKATGNINNETKDMSGTNTSEAVVEDVLIDEGPKEQLKFDCAVKSACLLVKPDSVYKCITKNVTKLQLMRALPLHFSLPDMLNKLDNLKDLDLSFNNMGPQCFRAVCLAMCKNSSILSLNLADNKADTDSADCIGKLLEENSSLQYLDVSSNYLGKDYFSRIVGPALKTNTALKTLRCESIGTTDARLLIEGLQSNTNLTELDISSNDISDKAVFGKGLAECLKRQDCKLTTISLSRCDLNAVAVTEIEKGLQENNSLCELNLTGAQLDSLGGLVSLISTASRHPCMRNLSLDSVKSKSQDLKSDVQQCESTSCLQVLSLNSCGLVDGVFTSLEKSCKGKLVNLVEIDLTSNENLTLQCLDSLAKITTAEEGQSSLRRLRYGNNKGDNLPEKLTEFPNLQYLNLRLCHLSHTDISQLGKHLSEKDCSVSTVILDGLKLSGTDSIKDLLVNPKTSKLTTLSLGGCSLDDSDLLPLCNAIKEGLQLSMLKLSANRITDEGVTKLVEAMLKNKAYPLAVLDLSTNRIQGTGAKSLTKLFSSKSKLHSLNVSSNNIDKEGLLALASVVAGKSPLQTLHVHDQSSKQDEGSMVEIFAKLAGSLGYKIQMDGDKVKPGCCDLPSNLPDGLLVNLTNMGGHTGNVGQAIDSRCIKTDFIQERLPSLSFHHIMQICCFLKGKSTEKCVWSENEWDMITGADRPTTDTPSWLKLPAQRDRCIYVSNLPGNATLQKLEAILEMDADCSVEETCMMKDPVTRSINGVGWVVMSDQESVTKAIDYFNSGEAKLFGQAFMMSEVKVQVDNDASAEIEQKAVADRETRQKLRAREEAEHKTLIINTTEASWKRHAYRLAHPAYADGRIW